VGARREGRGNLWRTIKRIEFLRRAGEWEEGERSLYRVSYTRRTKPLGTKAAAVTTKCSRI